MRLTKEQRASCLEIADIVGGKPRDVILALLADLEESESELEEWRFTNRIDELCRRVDRAESDLAATRKQLEESQAEYSALAQEHCVVLDSKDLELAEAQAKLARIADIENRYNCGDWDEIEEARAIASDGNTSALTSAIEAAVEPWRALADKMQRHMLRTPDADLLTIEFAALSAKEQQ